MTVEDINNAIEKQIENKDELATFTPTKKIGDKVEFDDDKQQWLIFSAFRGKEISQPSMVMATFLTLNC